MIFDDENSVDRHVTQCDNDILPVCQVFTRHAGPERQVTFRSETEVARILSSLKGSV